MAASLPSCALACFKAAIVKSECDPTDIACTCQDEAFQAQVNACVKASCTIPDVLTAANASYTSCGVEPRVDHSYVPTLLVFIVIAAVVVTTRGLARLVAGVKLWWDDWANFVAMLICIAYTAVGVVYKEFEFGKDMWAVQHENITKQLQAFYIMAMFYIIARLLIRVSIILFYMRIFRIDNKARRLMWITLISTIVMSFPLMMSTILLCMPVSYFWNRWDDMHEGYCVNSKLLLWIGWVVLLVNDFWIMGVPLPFVARLQLSRTRKLLVSSMFCMGLVVVAISIYKLTLIDLYTRGANATYDTVPMAIWGGIEIDIGVVCACMPSMPGLFRPLIVRIKSTLGTSKASSEGSKASRYANISESSDVSTSKRRRFSSSLPKSFHGRGISSIQMTTTVHQSRAHNDSDGELPLNSPLPELSPRPGGVTSQAWS